MSENPYQPSGPSSAPQKTRPTRWLVYSGAAFLGLAVACLASTVVGMFTVFRETAKTGRPARPAELADGIYSVLFPSLVSAPLIVLGIALLVAGFVVRQPRD